MKSNEAGGIELLEDGIEGGRSRLVPREWQLECRTYELCMPVASCVTEMVQ